MIQAINRAAAILRAVAGERGMKLADLARAVKLHKTTAFHLAETLVAEGMLTKEAGLYRVGPFWGAMASRAAAPWYETVIPPLSALHREFPEWSLIVSDLGQAELFMRLSFEPAAVGRAKAVNDSTLNPYTSVSGLLHFAFGPEEGLSELRLRHPFETRGLEAWGSWAAFEKAVKEARKTGYSETPRITHREQIKFALPLADSHGNFRGALTLTAMRKGLANPEAIRAKIRERLKALRSAAEATPGGTP